jgi:hypothetical protein
MWILDNPDTARERGKRRRSRDFKFGDGVGNWQARVSGDKKDY